MRPHLRRLAAAVSAALAVALGAGAALSTEADAASPPRTLSVLDARMEAAIRKAPSVHYGHETVVSGTPSQQTTGVGRWVKGAVWYDVEDLSVPNGLRTRTIVTSAGYFMQDGDATGFGPWERLDEHVTSKISSNGAGVAQLERQNLDPARMLPGLGSLRVTAARSKQKVDGVPCTVYSVRTTAEKAFATQPPATRPEPEFVAGGISVVTFYVDAKGLPRKVVKLWAWPGKGSYTEAFTYRNWGSKVSVVAPSV